MTRALQDGTSNLDRLAMWEEDILPGMSVSINVSEMVSLLENVGNMNGIVLKRMPGACQHMKGLSASFSLMRT
jgi:hypothetical protein